MCKAHSPHSDCDSSAPAFTSHLCGDQDEPEVRDGAPAGPLLGVCACSPAHVQPSRPPGTHENFPKPRMACHSPHLPFKIWAPNRDIKQMSVIVFRKHTERGQVMLSSANGDLVASCHPAPTADALSRALRGQAALSLQWRQDWSVRPPEHEKENESPVTGAAVFLDSTFG